MRCEREADLHAADTEDVKSHSSSDIPSAVSFYYFSSSFKWINSGNVISEVDRTNEG